MGKEKNTTRCLRFTDVRNTTHIMFLAKGFTKIIRLNPFIIRKVIDDEVVEVENVKNLR